jgi:hypothetical protein
MNFSYELLSDPELSLTFIEENLSKFNQAEFNILSIFNKHITSEFVKKYDSYPWAYSFHQLNLLNLKSILPIDYDELKRQNKQDLYNKFEKFEIKQDIGVLNKHRHIKKN